MPTAIKTLSSLTTTPVTQVSLTNAIRTAMANAGYPATYDEFTDASSVNWLIYQLANDTTKIKGTIYLQISIGSNLAVNQRLSEDWNTATNSSSVTSNTATAYTFGTGSQIDFTALNHPEFKGICIEQAANYAILGFFRPANKPSWWDENTFAFCFVPQSNVFTIFLGLHGAASPYNQATTTYYTFLLETKMGVANPITNRRDILPGCVLMSASNNQGIAGRTSEDFVSVAASNLTRLDILQVSNTEEYTLFGPVTMATAIRTK